MTLRDLAPSSGESSRSHCSQLGHWPAATSPKTKPWNASASSCVLSSGFYFYSAKRASYQDRKRQPTLAHLAQPRQLVLYSDLVVLLSNLRERMLYPISSLSKLRCSKKYRLQPIHHNTAFEYAWSSVCRVPVPSLFGSQWCQVCVPLTAPNLAQP